MSNVGSGEHLAHLASFRFGVEMEIEWLDVFILLTWLGIFLPPPTKRNMLDYALSSRISDLEARKGLN